MKYFGPTRLSIVFMKLLDYMVKIPSYMKVMILRTFLSRDCTGSFLSFGYCMLSLRRVFQILLVIFAFTTATTLPIWLESFSLQSYVGSVNIRGRLKRNIIFYEGKVPRIDCCLVFLYLLSCVLKTFSIVTWEIAR